MSTTRQLCSLSKQGMVEVWGSRVGADWWHWLRGDEVGERPTTRRSVGHSHVLPPELRTDEGARAVIVRLLHKAAARLRKLDCVASRIDFGVSYAKGYDGGWPKWRARAPLGRSGDTPTMLRALDEAWRACPRGGVPLKASVTLSKLTPAAATPRSLFAEDRQAAQAAETMDAVNARVGSNALYFASMHTTRDAAPMRIAFTNIPELDTATEAAEVPGKI